MKNLARSLPLSLVLLLSACIMESNEEAKGEPLARNSYTYRGTALEENFVVDSAITSQCFRARAFYSISAAREPRIDSGDFNTCQPSYTILPLYVVHGVDTLGPAPDQERGLGYYRIQWKEPELGPDWTREIKMNPEGCQGQCGILGRVEWGSREVRLYEDFVREKASGHRLSVSNILNQLFELRFDRITPL